jgi:hypothetical protein
MYRLKPFGVLNGREVPVIELFSDKCAVELLPYGAAVRAIRVPDRTGKLTDICLGYDELESYRTLDACFGGTIGRCANRIAFGPSTAGRTASRPTRGKTASTAESRASTRNCGNLPARKTQSPSPTPLLTARRAFPALSGWRSPTD